MEFQNSYEDDVYAAAYARMEFPGTYYLAYRDLPDIFSRHANGHCAIDVGCGTGRSTRFLQKHGFTAVGVDIAEEMIHKAREIDPSGDYRHLADGKLAPFADNTFDLALAAFTFDNIPTDAKKIELLRDLRRAIADRGRIVLLVSSPEIYRNEWASFTTKGFPENFRAESGDSVKIIVTALEDKRPVVDVVWSDEAYRKTFARSSLEVIDVVRPLGRKDEPFEWICETTIPPWTVYVLKMS